MGTILFLALGISVAGIALHGSMRVPDDLFTDEAEVSPDFLYDAVLIGCIAAKSIWGCYSAHRVIGHWVCLIAWGSLLHCGLVWPQKCAADYVNIYKTLPMSEMVGYDAAALICFAAKGLPSFSHLLIGASASMACAVLNLLHSGHDEAGGLFPVGKRMVIQSVWAFADAARLVWLPHSTHVFCGQRSQPGLSCCSKQQCTDLDMLAAQQSVLSNIRKSVVHSVGEDI